MEQVGTSVEPEKIGHKRVHWRALILMGDQKLPGHIVGISDNNASLLSRYSFPVGSNLHLAVFVPDAQDRAKSIVTDISAKVAYQVMRDDEVVLGLNLPKLPAQTVLAIRAVLRQDA